MSYSVWIHAFRLKTLPLAAATVLLGNSLAYFYGSFSWPIAFMTLLTTFLLQILSNLANDYGDAKNGVDNEYRIGPKRAVQSGLIPLKTMRKAVILFIILSLMSGVVLLICSFEELLNPLFLAFLLLGLGSIYAAIKYTIGKKPYGYWGMGDLFVLIFFGWVAVAGTCFLHTKFFNIEILLPATSIGLLCVGVLNLNNMRDASHDVLVGKKTISVILGESRSRKYHVFLLTMAIICAIIFAILNFKELKQWFFLIFTLPLILGGVRVYRNKISAHLDPELKKLALSTLMFSISFGLALCLPLILKNN